MKYYNRLLREHIFDQGNGEVINITDDWRILTTKILLAILEVLIDIYNKMK